MIKLIAVIDSVRGMVDNPPEELVALMRNKISKHASLVLYRESLDDISVVIKDVAKLEQPIWVLGNAYELKQAMPYVQEIHIIQLDGIFESSQEFPAFEEKFYMTKRKPIQQVNGVKYQCQVWKLDSTNLKDSWDFDIRDDF